MRYNVYVEFLHEVKMYDGWLDTLCSRKQMEMHAKSSDDLKKSVQNMLDKNYRCPRITVLEWINVKKWTRNKK